MNQESGGRSRKSGSEMGGIMEKKICLSRDNKILAGVCGGIAEYFGVDPTLIRIIYMMLICCFVEITVFLYVVCWAIMPIGARD